MYKLFYILFNSLDEGDRINLLKLLYEKGGTALLSYSRTNSLDFILQKNFDKIIIERK